MSTAKAAIVESISERRLNGLASKTRNSAARLDRIKELASNLLEEAESLDHEHTLAEAAAAIENLSIESGVDFAAAVRRFEMQLIARALELTGGNQRRAARMLGLGATTLNYKIKQYELA